MATRRIREFTQKLVSKFLWGIGKISVFKCDFLKVYLHVFTLNLDATPTSNFQPIRFFDPDFLYKFTYLMTISAKPDQLASS